jgi:hypothetical protein
MKKIILILLILQISLSVNSQTRRIGNVGGHNYASGKSFPDTPCYCTYESLGAGEHQIDFAVDLSNGLVFIVKYLNKNKNEDYVYKVTSKLSFDGFLQPDKEYIISDKPLREANQIVFKSMSGNWKGWIASDSEVNIKKISEPDREVDNNNNKRSTQLEIKSVDSEKENRKWSERTTNKFNSLNNEYKTWSDSLNHVNKVFDWWEERLHPPFGDSIWYKNEVESITTALNMYYNDTIIVDSLIKVIVHGEKLSDKYTPKQIKKMVISSTKALKEKYGY